MSLTKIVHSVHMVTEDYSFLGKTSLQYFRICTCKMQRKEKTKHAEIFPMGTVIKQNSNAKIKVNNEALIFF